MIASGVPACVFPASFIALKAFNKTFLGLTMFEIDAVLAAVLVYVCIVTAPHMAELWRRREFVFPGF